MTITYYPKKSKSIIKIDITNTDFTKYKIITKAIIQIAGFRKITDKQITKLENKIAESVINKQGNNHRLGLWNGRFFIDERGEMHYCAGQDYISEMKYFRAWVRSL